MITNETKKIIVILLMCVFVVGVCVMIHDTLQKEPGLIHPHGPMADDGTGRPDGPMVRSGGIMYADGVYTTLFEGETVAVIPVPAYEECPRGERVYLGNYLKVVDSTGKVTLHWMYECKNTAWNRTPTVYDSPE
jgi:hypothetical protein